MKRAIDLLNEGINRSLHTISNIEVKNNRGHDQHGRRIALLTTVELKERIDSLNDSIKTYKRAQRVLKTHERRRNNQVNWHKISFFFFGLAFATLLLQMMTKSVSLGFVSGFATAYGMLSGLIGSDLL